MNPVAINASAAPPRHVAADPLKEAAREFEASFLAEMLKSAGVGETRKAFGGGAGEEAFSSLLTRNYAEKLAEAGGIGLSDRIYQALLAREAK